MDLIRARTIITMDPSRPAADALVVDGDRIVDVGNRAELSARYGSRRNLRVTDLGGATVIPGFNDNHLHAMSLGQFFSTLRLGGMSRDEIVEFLTDAWSDARPGELLVARGWDYPACPDPELAVLDRAFPENPVALIQFSGHGAWLNSRALRLFNITASTADPPGGRIARDGQGRPTGILTDDAVRPLHMRRFRHAMRSYAGARGYLSEALRHLAEAGITSVQDNTWLPSVVGYYRRFLEEGRLTVRMGCWSYGELWYGEPLMALRRFDDRRVRRGPVKLFLDGTFSTRTAWLLDGYAGEPDRTGTASHDQRWVDAAVARHARRGRQVAAHAIGDGAVRSFVNAVEAASARSPHVREARMRVEHGQLIHPRDVERMASLGVLASAQPHAAIDPAKDRAILGEERHLRAYPYRSLLDAGVALSFGSDVPGEESFNPLQGMQLAVDREGPQRITAEEALRAYTVGSAHAEFAEGWKGTLSPGMAADFVALDRDPLRVEPAALSGIRVLLTVMGGRVVYAAAEGYLPYGRAISERSEPL